MSLMKNPFYVLGATTRDNRRRLTEMAEEKNLAGNSDEVNSARSVLTNPRKRLGAEMSWFPGLSPKNVDVILTYLRPLQLLYEPELRGHDLCATILLKAASQPPPIELSQFDPLVQLNIRLEQIRLKPFSNVQSAAAAIVEMDQIFDLIEAEKVLKLINQDRIVSGFSQVDNIGLIEEELGTIRTTVKSILISKMSDMSLDEYIGLVNVLANICFTPTSRHAGAIVDDILDSYELKTKNIIQQGLVEIKALTEEIRRGLEKSTYEDDLDILIEKVKRWDIIANPLQLNAHAKGTEHNESRELATVVRLLAIDLHNEYHRTDEAIRITTMLKDVFAELEELKELFEGDVQTLEEIQNQRVEYEEKVNQRNKENKLYSVAIGSESLLIPPYCTCCMHPTQSKDKVSKSITERSYGTRRTRSISVDFPLCDPCKQHKKDLLIRKIVIAIVTLGLSTALLAILAPKVQNYNVAAGIYVISTAAIYWLIGSIVTLKPLSDEHSCREESVSIEGLTMQGSTVSYCFSNWQFANLFGDANNAQVLVREKKNQTASNTFIRSAAHPVIHTIQTVVASFILAILLGSTFSNSSAQNAVPSSKAPTTTTQPSKPTTQPSQKSKDQLKTELDTQEAAIIQMENKLKSMENDLDYYKGLAERTNNNNYIDQYNSLVDDYEHYYSQYTNAINQYNVKVNQYNALNR